MAVKKKCILTIFTAPVSGSAHYTSDMWYVVSQKLQKELPNIRAQLSLLVVSTHARD